MGASPGCCQVRQKGFKDYLQDMVGSSYKQRWLYITTIENLFFFFSIASAQEAAVMIFFKISAE